VFHHAFFNSVIDEYQHMHFFTFNTVLLLKILNYSVTLTRYRPTHWWWSVKIETCRSTFKYFYCIL